jgi:hypothetical protein
MIVIVMSTLILEDTKLRKRNLVLYSGKYGIHEFQIINQFKFTHYCNS